MMNGNNVARDKKSGAVVNTSTPELNSYKKTKSILAQKNQKILDIEDRLVRMELRLQKLTGEVE